MKAQPTVTSEDNESSQRRPEDLVKEHTTLSHDRPIIEGILRLREALASLLSSQNGSVKNADLIWLLKNVAEEILQNTIEDDCVNIEPIEQDISDLFASIAEGRPLSNKISQVMQQIAKNRQETHRVAANLKNLSFIGFVPKERLKTWVSSQQQFFVPILEESLAEPGYGPSLTDAFADKLDQHKKKYKISTLCFVEKVAGPIGALAMLQSMVEKTGLPACIYREHYLAERTRFSGREPGPKDKVAIVYDLFVTGNGLKNVREALRHDYKCEAVSATVLKAVATREEVENFIKETEIQVEVLAWDNVEEEAESIQNGITKKTSRLEVISEEEDSASSLLQGGVRPPPQWRPLIGQYGAEQLTALHFGSRERLFTALELIRNKEELEGMPSELPGRHALIVPKEAVEYFRDLSPEVVGVTSRGRRTSALK